MACQNGAWQLARASKTGNKNLQAGRECQDHCFYVTVPTAGEDALVAAVADGMGSAPESARGSRIAINVAVAQAARDLYREPAPPPERLETILDNAVLAARNRIQEVAARDGIPPRHMATTLLLAIHMDGVLATAQVGDGAAVVSTTEGEYVTFSKPQQGEYANETYSVTSRRALQHCAIDIAKPDQPLRSIALMTDGIVPLTLATADHQPHRPFFSMLEQWLLNHPGRPHPNLELGALLESDKIRRKTDDDTTLLMAVRKCQQEPHQSS